MPPWCQSNMQPDLNALDCTRIELDYWFAPVDEHNQQNHDLSRSLTIFTQIQDKAFSPIVMEGKTTNFIIAYKDISLNTLSVIT